jgi:signal transduction histidine kinase
MPSDCLKRLDYDERRRLHLDVLLDSRAEAIAAAWMARILEDSASPYHALPKEDLYASILTFVHGIARALGPEGECALLKEHLTGLATTRLALGFSIASIVQALLLGKGAFAPYLLEAYERNPADLRASMALLDECLLQSVVYFIGRYTAEMDQRLQEEQARAIQNARQVATLEERERLAGEMHDRLAQALGYLNLGLSGVDQALAEGQVDEARARLAELKQVVKQTYTDVREAIFNLRIRSDPQTPFLPTLQEYLAEYQSHYGVHVDLLVEDEGLVRFPPQVKIQILRIIQEALTNVRKHAGTDRARIRMERAEEKVRISIEDEGQGFDLARATPGGEEQFFGLQIMYERARAAGGSLEVRSAPGQGTRIVLDLPLSEEGTDGS